MLQKFSRLGFGLSTIADSGDVRHQSLLINTAIENGITHFDVSPDYDTGEAEVILGKVLATCSEKVTITTKHAFTPIDGGRIDEVPKKFFHPVFRVQQVLRKLTSSLITQKNKTGQPDFRKGILISSLDKRSRKLGRPIDICLLHDVDVSFASFPPLLEELHQIRTSGRAGATGISGSAVDVVKLVSLHKAVYQVAQTENSISCMAPMAQLRQTDAIIITCGAIRGGLAELSFLLQQRPNFRKVWSREFGVDPNERNLIKILTELALFENPDGTVLFSTRKPERIKDVAGVVDAPVLGPEGVELLRKLVMQTRIKELPVLKSYGFSFFR